MVLTLPRRTDVIAGWKESCGFVAAVFPIHYPRELLRAFGILPVEVWGPPGIEADHGATHLQPYLCSVVRNGLSFLLAGGLDVVDLLVVPHACDSLQGLGSILLDFVTPRQPVLPIYLPRGLRECDVGFLADEFRSLYGQLETVTGRSPTEAELSAHIQREEEADESLAQLHQGRSACPLSDAAFYRLLRSREYLPAETFADLSRQVLAIASSPRQAGGGVPLILSGILPEPMDLFEALAGMGGRVVADDLACCGRRLYPPGRSGEPFRRMAERIVYAPPDPTRGNPIQERLEHLLRLVDASGAKGVVFYNVKFCEPELFDYPDLGRGLQRAGIPSLTVEVDLNDPVSQRVLTRLEAFLEMIR
jgi:benzoyl-CoA reductase/2-hydroxyglutaryl-CoA dehydratase subunit BcrC/BadD/HgdB